MRREDYDHIPTYYGDSKNVLYFTTFVQEIFQIVCAENVAQRDMNNLLLSQIKSRLTGLALSLVLANPTIGSVGELLSILNQHFAYSKTVEALKFDIYDMKLGPKETPNEYLNKVESHRSLIQTRLQLDGLHGQQQCQNMSQVDKEIIYHTYGCFPWQLTNHIMTFDPKNLNDLRRILNTTCQFIIDQLYNKRRPYAKPLPPRPNQYYSQSNTQNHSTNPFRNSSPFQKNHAFNQHIG